MKKFIFVLSSIILLFPTAFIILESINWKVKEEAYAVKFSGGKVDGIIKGLKATIAFDEANPEKSIIVATMDANTVNTGNGLMTKHALSESALNAAAFPTIKFESSSVRGKDGKYSATGKLTLKGITKEINMPFTFDNQGGAGVFKGKFSIAPKDYNITRSGTPDVVEIELTIPVAK